MNIVVVGASGGLGSALLSHMHRELPAAQFLATWNSTKPSVFSERISWHQCDTTNESDIANLASFSKEKFGCINWCINAVGLLHDKGRLPEKTIARLDANFFKHNMEINALPTLLLAKHFNKDFDKNQPGLFATLSAKVGSIEDNQLGGWLSYRCSKAALNMALKTLSIEWRHSHPKLCVAVLHPGTADTSLSKPFTAKISDEKLFSPQRSAQYLYQIMARLEPKDTGKFWAWDGSELPW